MQVKSAGEREYECIVVDDYTCGVHTTTAAQVGSAGSPQDIQGRSRERIPEKNARNHDGQRAPAVYGEMKVICEQEGIRLHTSVWYSSDRTG